MSRADKVAEEIKHEVSKVLQEEVHDPRLGFTTITKVDLTPDLRFARIFFSVYGNEQQWKDTQDALTHAVGFIRRTLGARMKLRFVPEILFQSDHSSEYSIIVEQQLEEIHLLNKPEPKQKRKKDVASKTRKRTTKKKK